MKETKEQQPQPDEELVKIVKKAFDRYNSDVPEPILAEIRKLLPPQPTITRGEIEQWVTMLIGDYADNKEYFKQCVTMTVNLFKSKGVDVRGEK